MKTLIIYNDIETPIQYLIVDGDYSRFNGVMVNTVVGNGYEEEFVNWMFNSETGEENHIGQWSEDVSVIQNKNWDKVAVCTFLS